MRLRIRFKKYGPMRFIGHLDVMRFFQKAIRRAGIDVAYSKGFSPHQIMAFAAPLGVGLASNGEYMDIEVNSMQSVSSPGETCLLSCQDMVMRLNQVSVPGIEVTSVKILPESAGNAMASVAAAAYTVRFRTDSSPDMTAILPEFLARKQILITKETKKGTREIDIRPGIFQLACQDEALTMLVDASSGGNIKPVQVMEALLAEGETPETSSAFLITREDLYTRIETPEGMKLVSLDEIGTLHTDAVIPE